MTLDTGLAAVLITILLSIIGFAFGYGMLSQKVNAHSLAIKELESSAKLIDAKLDIIITRTAVIEALAAKMNGK